MKDEFAPWRAEYFTRDKSSKCIFCDIAQNPQNDAENFVLFRAKNCFGVMNRYPYTLGEFMVIPYEHIDNIESLNPDIWHKTPSCLLKYTCSICKSCLKIRINLGVVSEKRKLLI